MNLADQQRKTRDGLGVQREAARATLIEMQKQRAALTAETARVEAATGPVRYIAIMLGTDAETAVRSLMLLMVLCCDPAAIALTIAVAGTSIHRKTEMSVDDLVKFAFEGKAEVGLQSRRVSF